MTMDLDAGGRRCSSKGFSRSVRLDTLYGRALVRMVRRARVVVSDPQGAREGTPLREALDLCQALWEAAGKEWPDGAGLQQ